MIERICENTDCENVFYVYHESDKQKFCSHSCSNKINGKKRKENNKKKEIETKICPRCGTEHSKRGVFCSRNCANVRIFSSESLEKKKKSAIEMWKHMSVESISNINKALENAAETNKAKTIKRLMKTPTEQLYIKNIRKKLMIEQNNKCAICKLDTWRNLPIALELDHKDGNNKNNYQNNL